MHYFYVILHLYRRNFDYEDQVTWKEPGRIEEGRIG